MNSITNEDVMKEHMENLSIREDDKILDFGCGDGTFTIPFARMLNNNGKIFAMDSDASKLEKLRDNAIKAGLEDRIQIIQTNNKLVIPVDDESIDTTLLYNVACCIHGKENQEDLIKLIRDIKRVTKESGRLIINIKGKHIEKRIDNALPEIQTYFKLEEKEMKKYFLKDKRERYRFFYYLIKKE